MRSRLLAFGRFADDPRRRLANIFVAVVGVKLSSYPALHFFASRISIQKHSAALVALVSEGRCADPIKRDQLPFLFLHALSLSQVQYQFQPCENQTAPVPNCIPGCDPRWPRGSILGFGGLVFGGSVRLTPIQS